LSEDRFTVLVARSDGPLFYANVANLRDQLLAAIVTAPERPRVVVLDLSETPDLDVDTLDGLAELAETLAADGIEFRLAAVRGRALELLRRSGLADGLRIEPTLDAAAEVFARSATGGGKLAGCDASGHPR
jgi:MFS superfamily sulfate permease-like transporter